MNKKYLKLAIEKALMSGSDIPVGAVVVKEGQILAAVYNQKEEFQDATLHAEVIAIKEASKVLNNWRLDGCDLYVTLEPCPMCAAAIIQSRVSSVYFGSYDLQYGALGSKIDLRDMYSSKLNVVGGIMQEECDKLLNSYFENMRNEQK